MASDIRTRLAKVLLEAETLDKAAGRLRYAAAKAIEELDAIEAAPAPTPTPTPTPAPSPNVAIDGQPTSFTEIEPFVTPTGTWPVSIHRGEGFAALLFGLATDPAWWSVCIAQYADPAATALVEAVHSVTVNGVDHRVTAFPGSIKMLESYSPVQPDMARVVAAMEAGLIPSYHRSAFAGWGEPRELVAQRYAAEYRPDRIYGRDSGMSAIGNVSASGGEYGSSRGFLSETDSVTIAAALAGDQGSFDFAVSLAHAETFYGLSLPNLAIFSPNHAALRDPQHPFAGDRPYINEGSRTGADVLNTNIKWIAPGDSPFLTDIGAVAGTPYSHKRDIAHLFNHGLAYWFATGDPRAALLQQAIAAYALAAPYQGPHNETDYAIRFGYQRTTLNCFTAMWKLAAVQRDCTGGVMWSPGRIAQMVRTVLDDWEAHIAEMDASSDPKARMMSVFRAIDNGPSVMSDFMNQDYGPEVAWLFASNGRGALLTRLAENMVIRVVRIGGSRGIDTDEGSNLFAVDGSAVTLEELIVGQFDGDTSPNDSLDGSAAHTAMRAYWLLRFAQDAVTKGWIAPVVDLDKAVEMFERWRDASPDLRYRELLAWDHAAVPFG